MTGLVLALASVLMIFAVEAYLQEQSIGKLAARAVVPVVPQAPFVMCRDLVTASCALRAADTSGLSVAWMSAPSGFHLAWFYASKDSGENTVAEGMFLPDTGGLAQISLDSATRIKPRLTVIGSVSNGKETALLSQERVDGAVVENQLQWTHGGTSYSMLGVGSSVSARTLVQAWKGVQYAAPHSTP